MKHIILSLALLLFAGGVFAEEEQKTIMLSGASFGVKENGWFELGCDAFRANAINKSVLAESIKDTAKKLFMGTFYTKPELEATDIFVIMHVHNQDVANTSGIKEDYTQYTYDEITNEYWIAYDYVIKKYMDDCLQLKYDATSKYYNTENGKPAVIVLCTHWHDSRTKYNADIRTLADKWQFPLVKWDENIGFTKNVPDEDGKQPSLKYSIDTEVIESITYGWHPAKGKDKYIQRKMAEIFVTEMENLLGKIPVSVTAKAKSSIIKNGEEAYVKFAFTGLSPWNLTYEIDGRQFNMPDITESPLMLKIDVQAEGITQIKPIAVSNGTETDGHVSGAVTIGYMDKYVVPYFDTHVHQANSTTTYQTSEILDLKIINADKYAREVFISFKLNEFESDNSKMALRMFFDDLIYSGSTVEESHLIELRGNTKSYSSVTWNNKPSDFEKIDEMWVLPAEKKTYVAWDVTDWLTQQINKGETQVTFYMKVTAGGSGLLRFPSIEASANKPEILITKDIHTGIAGTESKEAGAYPNPFKNYIKLDNIENGSIALYSADGKKMRCSLSSADNGAYINTGNLPAGVYFLKHESNGTFLTKKMIKNQ